ncbi:SAM-dependent methyltransferase [Mycoplasmopsis primatum]|uniref:SAM-dependent methyltransferase n=1 Tax=Mycoplasmopsis primatum TaxID=55604 RepID=UPI00068EF54E|nr:SAM-dependent methyltransferase [Mycoplasmopsis primatum]
MQKTLKKIKDSNNYNKELDKFYTAPVIVDKVINHIKELLNEHNLNINNFNFIEPSAGAGAFIDGLKKNFDNPNIVAFDIHPEGKNIIKADFLNLTPQYSNNNIIIGNPPFGYRGSLAADFINKGFEWGPIIVFILPIQFRRYNIQKKINANLKLISSTENLPKNSFILSNSPYNVNCLIQVWVNKKYSALSDEADLRLYQPLPNKHEDFKLFIHNNTAETLKYFNKDKYMWDFAVARQGYYDYNHKITDPKELIKNVQYLFVKYESIISPKIFEKIDFKKLSNVNTSVPGFSNTDLVKEYVKIKNKFK